MKKVLNVYKPISITPYQLIKQIKIKLPEYSDLKFAYAGRLDPMAHGVMIYLIGDETKKRDKYQILKKTYRTKVVFGISTDTYDAMGMITSIDKSVNLQDVKAKIFEYQKNITGLKLQKYPPFSYPKINGEPMYKLAREGRLNEKDIPEKEIFIYSAEFLNYQKVNFSEIRKELFEKISRVDGDFRQQEIINKYKQLEDIDLVLVDAEFEVSSGTYIRSIANEIGRYSGFGAFAYDIYRTQVGEYNIRDAIRL